VLKYSAPDLSPELYGELYHKIRINYYPPHGDNKESWDNIDIFGWLGYHADQDQLPLQGFHTRGALVLDLALFADLSKRQAQRDPDWLSFYFKSPQVGPGLRPEHIFQAADHLQNALRKMMGEESLTRKPGLFCRAYTA